MDHEGGRGGVRDETQLVEVERDGYLISTDPERLDLDAIHAYLTRSYWAEGIPKDIVERSLRGSLCFGLYNGGEQVGLARVITDRATFAYLCDVYVLEAERGKGLSKWLLEVLVEHPALIYLRRFLLATRDAHALYARYGFTEPARPHMFMEIARPGLYKDGVTGP
ncbi:MAG TPA: GNAT family N-acetyltransferase [Polyangiaceae bacterium]|nr:GNAT family N-acetyltransferase [Polyangiaceae bacterium]